MVYGRDVVVKCVRRHYDLLVRMAYLDPAVIQHPPPDGWTDAQLAVDLLQTFGRSEKVIDLLRHLPYIRRNLDDEKYEIYSLTWAISYLRDVDLLKGLTAESCRGANLWYWLLMPFEADWPPSFISLTYGRDATYWGIDTEEGLIFPMGPLLEDPDAPEDQPWRQSGRPRSIQEYFDDIYSEIETLKIVPVPKGEWGWYNEMLPREYPKGQLAGRLLKEHGWPDALRKDDYLKALHREHPDAARY